MGTKCPAVQRGYQRMKAVFFRMCAQTYSNADPELPGIHFHHRRTVSAPAGSVNYPRYSPGIPDEKTVYGHKNGTAVA